MLLDRGRVAYVWFLGGVFGLLFGLMMRFGEWVSTYIYRNNPRIQGRNNLSTKRTSAMVKNTVFTYSADERASIYHNRFYNNIENVTNRQPVIPIA